MLMDIADLFLQQEIEKNFDSTLISVEFMIKFCILFPLIQGNRKINFLSTYLNIPKPLKILGFFFFLSLFESRLLPDCL